MLSTMSKVVKVAFIGAPKSGKSRLVGALRGFSVGHYVPTMGVSASPISAKTTSGELVTLNIWDTGANLKYNTTPDMYLTDSDIIVVMVNEFNVPTEDNIKRAKKYVDPCKICLYTYNDVIAKTLPELATKHGVKFSTRMTLTELADMV